jgi:hypothetical protein
LSSFFPSLLLTVSAACCHVLCLQCLSGAATAGEHWDLAFGRGVLTPACDAFLRNCQQSSDGGFVAASAWMSSHGVTSIAASRLCIANFLHFSHAK